MKKLLVSLLCLLPFSLFAQTYTVSSIPLNTDPLTSGTAVLLGIDDLHSPTVQLPFVFNYYGNSYSAVVLSANAYLSFDTTQAGQFSPWSIQDSAPSATTPSPAILAPYMDADPSIGGNILWNVYGTAPYRRFVATWYNVPLFSCNSDTLTTQIKLFETTNAIEIHLVNKPACPAWNGGASILGLTRDDTTATVVPGRNWPTVWSASNEGWCFGACGGGGTFGTVEGHVYTDVNGNCIYDSTDIPVPNRLVVANGNQSYTWTNQQGEYILTLDTGTHVITAPAPQYYATACPPAGQYTITLDSMTTSFDSLDFADTATVNCVDLDAGLGVPILRRCNSVMLTLSVCNHGTVADSNVILDMSLVDSMMILSSSVAYQSLGFNNYRVNVGTLNPGQCAYYYFMVTVGCDSLGTLYCLNAIADGDFSVDCDTLNDDDPTCYPIVGSFDPNEKYVAAQDLQARGYVMIDTMEASDRLDYIVHFQNTGTAPAFAVEIRDTLSPMLDGSSLQPGAASHPYVWAVFGNELRVEFPGIVLPDSNSNEPQSHGFVKFSVAQVQGNQPGSSIFNDAAIYFDQNAPIITAATENYIRLPLAVEQSLEAGPRVYPNPGMERLRIGAEAPFRFELYDISGKRRVATHSNGTELQLDTSTLPAGIYLYRIVQEGKAAVTGKWLKIERR